MASTELYLHDPLCRTVASWPIWAIRYRPCNGLDLTVGNRVARQGRWLPRSYTPPQVTVRRVVPPELLETIVLTDADRPGAPSRLEGSTDRQADRPAGHIGIGCNRGHRPLDAVDIEAFDVLPTPRRRPRPG